MSSTPECHRTPRHVLNDLYVMVLHRSVASRQIGTAAQSSHSSIRIHIQHGPMFARACRTRWPEALGSPELYRYRLFRDHDTTLAACRIHRVLVQCLVHQTRITLARHTKHERTVP